MQAALSSRLARAVARRGGQACRSRAVPGRAALSSSPPTASAPTAASLTLSGIQPTGQLHLGNYLGALVNWVRMQDEPGEALFTVVDMHAVTVPQEPEAFREQCLGTAATLLACGLDPAKCSIFLQSHVPAHAELMWMLGCVGRYSSLLRMTQFKEKSAKRGLDRASVGLFTYPVLMAADMLVYRATHVPVGDDQRQHLELTRELARQFNRQFKRDLFPQPQPLHATATRVMSLRDASSKMSKSDTNDASRINLVDTADDIRAKVRRAKMDGIVGLTLEPEARPEVANLLTIFAALDGREPADVAAQYAGASNVAFKGDLTDLLVQRVTPIGDEIRRLRAEPEHLERVLEAGRERAHSLAEETLREAKECMGFVAR